jgi:hypothetical protein
LASPKWSPVRAKGFQTVVSLFKLFLGHDTRLPFTTDDIFVANTVGKCNHFLPHSKAEQEVSMDKDISAGPNTNKKTKPVAKKKRATTKRPTTKTTAKNKKSSRAAKSTAKTKTASKTVSPRKKEPARKKRAPSKTGQPAKAAPKKPTLKSKTKKVTKTKEPAALPSRNKDTGEPLKIKTPETPLEIPKPEPPDMPPSQKDSWEIYPPTDVSRGSDPFKKFVRLVFVCFVILIAIMILISYQNMNKYFITSRDGAVEIWKGKFSPKRRERIVIMPGIQPPEQIKRIYTKEEVFPIVYRFYIGKADALMEVPGLPDFVGIKSYLNRALSYATTDALRNNAKVRLNSIDLMILLYKADAVASKGTVAGLEAAIKYLDQASTLGPDEIEAKLIKQKLASIQKLKEILSPKPKKTKSVKDKPEKQPLKKKSSK